MNFSKVREGQSQVTQGCYQREVHMLYTTLPVIRVFNMGTKIAQCSNRRLRVGQGNRFFFFCFADRASQYIYLSINHLDAQNFTLSLFHASTCFEHHVLIARRSKLYYTASGIITPPDDEHTMLETCRGMK